MFQCGIIFALSGISWNALDGSPGSQPSDRKRICALLSECDRRAEADAIMDQAGKSGNAADAEAAAEWFVASGDFVRAGAYADRRITLDPSDDAVVESALVRLWSHSDLDVAVKALVNRGALPLSDAKVYRVSVAARKCGREAALLPLLTANGSTNPNVIAALSWLHLATGDFSGMQKLVRELIDGQPMAPERLPPFYAIDRILAPMFGVEAADPIRYAEVMADPSVSEFQRLVLAWLDGKVGDTPAFARAAQLEPWTFLFFRGLRNLSTGHHDEARADFAQVVKLDIAGAWGGTSRSLLAWYAKQTPATLKQLEPKKAVIGVNDF